MPYYGFEDIPFMLAEFGQDAGWWNGTATITKKVIVDIADAELLDSLGGAAVLGKTIAVRGRTGDWPAVKIGDTLTLNTTDPGGSAEAHTIRDMRQEGDGAITLYLCTRP